LRTDPAFTGREDGIIKLECLREDSAAAVVNPPGVALSRPKLANDYREQRCRY